MHASSFVEFRSSTQQASPVGQAGRLSPEDTLEDRRDDCRTIFYES